MSEKPIIVKCPGCGVDVVWTGIYGPWCATCSPRGDLPKRTKERTK